LVDVVRRNVTAVGTAIVLLISVSPPMFAATTYLNGFPTDPGFFPIGVWLQSPHNAPEFQALGINTFVGLWKGPTEDQLAELAKNNMFVIAAQNDVALSSPNRSIVKGWMQGDEPDNAQSNGHGGYGPCITAADVAEGSLALKSRDSTRPVMINFGRGLADQWWIGRGKCRGDMKYYDIAVKGADILSFDIYPAASEQPNQQGKLEYVARGVDNLVQRASPEQSVWAVIETTFIGSHHIVTPTQLRSEVWMALIHGATGIVYFVHEWTGGFREDGIFRHPEIVNEVTSIDQTFKALAPVLNNPNLPGRPSVSSPAISTMVKEKDNVLYVFASSTQSADVNASFALSKVGNATAIVLGEDRTITISDGRLSDSFGGYGVHIYEIPLDMKH
jgi:hypothetical protein